jgi:hypothetical protein
MMKTMWRAIQRAAAPATGVACRRCAEPIRGDDPFGVSEHVCAPCRTDGTIRLSLRA